MIRACVDLAADVIFLIVKHTVDFDLVAKSYLHVHVVVVTAVYPDGHCPVVQFPGSGEVTQEGPQALSRIYVTMFIFGI